MSSSSSIAAARRRRAGGNAGPTPTNKPIQPQPPQQQALPNPLVLLQQHHMKITSMDKQINELIATGSNTETTSNSSQSHLDMNEITTNIMNNIEQQLDLKAFYDNDERLMNEIETLKTTVQSQQLLINSLNTSVNHLITKIEFSAIVASVPEEEHFQSLLDNDNDNEQIEKSTMMTDNTEKTTFSETILDQEKFNFTDVAVSIGENDISLEMLAKDTNVDVDVGLEVSA